MQDGAISVNILLGDGDFNLVSKNRLFSELRSSLAIRILQAMPSLEKEFVSLGFQAELKELQFYSYSPGIVNFELKLALPPGTHHDIRFINVMVNTQFGNDDLIPGITQMEVTRYTWDEPEDCAIFHRTQRLPSLEEIKDAYHLYILKDMIAYQERVNSSRAVEPEPTTKNGIDHPSKFRF